MHLPVLITLLAVTTTVATAQTTIYVSEHGKDSNAGSKKEPRGYSLYATCHNM